MSGSKSIFTGKSCCSSQCCNENKFVIMVDDTEDCKNPASYCMPTQGIPIQQVFIDLSDCKCQDCKCEDERGKCSLTCKNVILRCTEE